MESLYNRNEIDTLLLQKANKQDIPTKLSQLENDLQLGSSGNSSSSSSLAVNPFSYGMSSYFTSEPDSNCWTKADDTFISNAKYYDWLEKIQSGALSVEGVSVKLHTETYSEYDFAINPSNRTFRLPLLNGEECLPSDDKISLNILPSDSTYTAPQNGWYSFVVISSVANGTINLYCEETGLGQLLIANATQARRGSVQVSRGDVVHYIYPTNNTNVFFFTPAKGNGSLYYYTGATENTLSQDVEDLKSQLGDLSIILDNINGEVL